MVGRRALATTAALLLLLGACAPTSGGGPEQAASGSPARGGTLVLAIWQEPTTLAPIYVNQTVAGVVSETVVEGLLNTDTDGNFYPVLVKTVPTLDNGGVKISADGKKM